VQRAEAVCRGLLRTNRYAPGFVRLAFHDCVGGCNGCIDLAAPANKGNTYYSVDYIAYTLTIIYDGTLLYNT